MFLQVGLLCVRLATQVADVRLQVFRVFVLGYVLEQRQFVGEAFVAGVAFKWFVRLVAARVRLQIGELREGFRAASMAALVWFIPGMCADVLLQVRQLCEFALADLTSIWLDAQMDAGVL